MFFTFEQILSKQYSKSIYQNGVYKITNLITNDFYIGSASSKRRLDCQSGFYVRIHKHLKDLIQNRHNNKFLQRSFNKYGISNFSVEILAICPDNYCIKLEQWFIDTLKPTFNICKIAGSRKGTPLTEEHKRKIGLANSLNKEAGKNISKAKMGQKYNIVNKRTNFKKSEEGVINNRIKRRLHKSITRFNNNQDILDIRRDLIDGIPIKELANKYGVHYTTISDIKHNRTFKDIKHND